jgi:hypothetical protein
MTQIIMNTFQYVINNKLILGITRNLFRSYYSYVVTPELF